MAGKTPREKRARSAAFVEYGEWANPAWMLGSVAGLIERYSSAIPLRICHPWNEGMRHGMLGLRTALRSGNPPQTRANPRNLEQLVALVLSEGGEVIGLMWHGFVAIVFDMACGALRIYLVGPTILPLRR